MKIECNRFVAIARDAAGCITGSDTDNAILGDVSEHWYMSLSIADPRKGLFAENISFTKLNIETVAPRSPFLSHVPSCCSLLFIRVCTSCGYTRICIPMCVHRYTSKERSQAWIPGRCVCEWSLCYYTRACVASAEIGERDFSF